MTLAGFLGTVVLVLFFVTVVMAIGSYAAYKLRESRRPLAPAYAPARSIVAGGRMFERVDPAELELHVEPDAGV